MYENKISITYKNKWSGNAKKAMLDNPDYFIWWYTVKSVGLGVVAAYAAYLYGKQQSSKKRR